MKIAIRKEQNGLIYMDKSFFERFKEEDLEGCNYISLEIDDKYSDCTPSDFNEDLTFNVDKYNERKQENSKEELRLKREPLLIAFDKYKTNVVYGVEIESEEQRDKIIKWYQQIKDLNKDYIVKEENIPERIKYYL